MIPLAIGSLFSGIGGLDLSVEAHFAALGFDARTVWQVEHDAFCNSIHRDATLEEREEEFAATQRAGVVPTEHTPSAQFWSEARKAVASLSARADDERAIPCECVFRRTKPARDLTPCTCFAARGVGHALHCARVFGDDPRVARAA